MFKAGHFEQMTMVLSDLNELQKIVESEILTDRFRQRRLPEGTFDEDACVICYDQGFHLT